MQKTKLGITVGFMGAILYCLGLFSGYFVTVAAVAYVLIAEENIWLRKTAVKVLALTFLFPIIRTIIGVIPDAIGFINNIMNLFNDTFEVEIISKIVVILNNIVNIAEYVIFILLGIRAFSQGTIKIPVVDSIINKHVN